MDNFICLNGWRVFFKWIAAAIWTAGKFSEWMTQSVQMASYWSWMDDKWIANGKQMVFRCLNGYLLVYIFAWEVAYGADNRLQILFLSPLCFSQHPTSHMYVVNSIFCLFFFLLMAFCALYRKLYCVFTNLLIFCLVLCPLS